MDLASKCAIVTGGGSGLGILYAETLASHGASVVVADLDGEAADRIATDLNDKGLSAIGVQADVTSDDDVDRMVQSAVDAFGRIDILLNNAALSRGRFNLCSELSTAEWIAILSTNVVGPLVCARACRPVMARQGGGIIINKSSSAGYHAVEGAYHISKLSLSGLTVALAAEFASDNIRVNGIAPGSVTQRLPKDILEKVLADQAIKRFGTPQDLIGALLYLCSDASSFMTGHTMVVDGGTVLRP
jgi:NAD(P)-dependent dehydrogenase (short-subunit alcohol dehydrogenase family)